MKRTLKLTKEVAVYLIEKDMQNRGWLVTDKEAAIGLEMVKKNMKKYVLLNGDMICHSHGSWVVERKTNG